MNSKPFRCSMYLLKYIYDDDIEALKIYEEMYKKLPFEDKKKVSQYVIANLLEQFKSEKLPKIKNERREFVKSDYIDIINTQNENNDKVKRKGEMKYE